VREQDALATAGATPALLLGEPTEETEFEFLGSGVEGAAVVGLGDFPQDCVWGAGVDALRVTDGDVAVDLAVNQ
jgi:hypothetical protein